MPLVRLLQELVGVAAGDFGRHTDHERNADTSGDMVDNQSLATLCQTPNCGTHVVRGTACPKCNAVCPANTGSL